MTDREAMELALAEAKLATAHGDVPVGAVVVLGDTVLAARHNERELRGDPTAHAELLAIREAATARGRADLAGCTVAVTLEPCPMCAGALVASCVGRLVYGATDPKAGACGTLFDIFPAPGDPTAEVVAGIAAASASALLVAFFAELRSTRRRPRP
jgi:tRNA(adenine34) deaminase